MDHMKLLRTAPDWLKKYRYVVLVLAVGIVLMLLPSKGDGTVEETVPTVQSETKADISIKLADLLSHIDGAGRVEVMLTVAAGEETVYQTNEAYSNGTDSGSTTVDTVTVTDSGRNQTGLVKQVNPERYLGAIIVCQGADDPAVRLAIVEAVADITGLGTDKISVLKMK